MAARDLVVMGGSAGAVEGALHVVGQLPANFPAAVLVVVHISPEGPSALASILDRAGPLPASVPLDGEKIEPGHIYVAAPNRHLLVRDACVWCGDGPRENRHRPAIDPLFRTAAREYQQRVIAVLLSGNLDDGSAGLLEVKKFGGTAVVLDPADAAYPAMPRNALEAVPDVDHVVSLAEIPDLLVELTNQPVSTVRSSSSMLRDTAEIGALDIDDATQPGRPSGFSCPDCGGVLWEVEEGELLRYRCRTGHAYAPESLLNSQMVSVEEALSHAIRALAETAVQARALGRRMRDRGHEISARRFITRAEDAEHRAAVIREALLGLQASRAADLQAG